MGELLTPIKKATPKATIATMDKNLPLDFKISLIKSLFKALSYYHSILSTGVGFSLIVIELIFPFLTFITLSPIGVKAKL